MYLCSVSVRLAVTAVRAADGRLNQARAVAVAPAQDWKQPVAGMPGRRERDGRGGVRMQVPSDRIAHELSKFLICHV